MSGEKSGEDEDKKPLSLTPLCMCGLGPQAQDRLLAWKAHETDKLFAIY